MSAALNPEELNALMSAIQESRVPTTSSGPGLSPKADVVSYDLTSQDRIIRGQMPTLDAINERIASMLASGLSGRTRLSIRVNTTPATLLKFADFNVLLAPPATLCILALGPGHGLGVAVLEPGLAEALLAAALGDRKARKDEVPPDQARHELTTVEKLVLRRLLSILSEAMTVAWVDVLPLKPEVLRFESDPRLATIAPPNDVAVLSSFELSGAITGRLQLAIPYASVETAKKLLSSPPRMGFGGDARFSSQFTEELSKVDVELSAVLGKAKLTLQKLLALNTGDVLSLDSDEGDPLDILVQGRPKLTGRPQVSGSSLSIIVERDVRGRTGAPAKPDASFSQSLNATEKT